MSEHEPLEHYLAAWELAQPQLLEATRTGQIYTVARGADTLILKLLDPTETEERRGAVALRVFDGHGAVRLLRSDHGAQLLEYADGEPLVALVERGDDERATRIIAGVLGSLHGVPQPTSYDGLLPLERWFAALFAQAAADQQAPRATIFVRAAELARQLLDEQREVRALHGDIHHYNIRQAPRGWLAFDPKGLAGERTYDCANTLCNPGLPELVFSETRLLATARLLASELELDLGRVLAFAYAYACLNAARWLKLGDVGIVAWFLTVARLVEPQLGRARG